MTGGSYTRLCLRLVSCGRLWVSEGDIEATHRDYGAGAKMATWLPGLHHASVCYRRKSHPPSGTWRNTRDPDYRPGRYWTWDLHSAGVGGLPLASMDIVLERGCLT
jgi:hypothetical protein